ncbi:MAG: hypothetical protein AAGA78_11320 [Pseudomonadota bacterium]
MRRSFTVLGIVLAGILFAAGSMAQDYKPPQGSDRGAGSVHFDGVKETGFLCYDRGELRLLSVTKRPEAHRCTNLYAECQEDACMIVVHGSVRHAKKSFLERFVADRIVNIPQPAAGLPGFPDFPGTGWTPQGFADPLCSYYHQLGFDCPEAPGLPGGGSSPPPGTGTPGTPGPNNNCWLCTAAYTLCFANAGVNPILQAQCISEMQDCAARRCG